MAATMSVGDCVGLGGKIEVEASGLCKLGLTCRRWEGESNGGEVCISDLDPR
jgi:hypothetical protein